MLRRNGPAVKIKKPITHGEMNAHPTKFSRSRFPRKVPGL
jgi:hypothetical protein